MRVHKRPYQNTINGLRYRHWPFKEAGREYSFDLMELNYRTAYIQNKTNRINNIILK
jgi:hypothetical protein